MKDLEAGEETFTDGGDGGASAKETALRGGEGVGGEDEERDVMGDLVPSGKKRGSDIERRFSTNMETAHDRDAILALIKLKKQHLGGDRYV
jgi:hypothetical protein